MKNKISVAIIGAGKMSREYIKVFLANEKFEIKAIIGRSQKNLKLLSKKFPNLLFTNDLKSFLKKNIDLTIICVSEDQILNVTKVISKFKTTILLKNQLELIFLKQKNYEYS